MVPRTFSHRNRTKITAAVAVLVLLALALIALVGEATIARPCYSYERSESIHSEVMARAVVTYYYDAEARMSIVDKYYDRNKVTGHYILAVADWIEERWVEVPKGGDLSVALIWEGSYASSFVESFVNGERETDADVLAYWTEMCPASSP